MKIPPKRLKPFFRSKDFEVVTLVDKENKIVGFSVNEKKFPVKNGDIIAAYKKVEKLTSLKK